MTDRAAVITDTLQQVAERVGDPTALVFQRLFAANPDMEALFVRDTAGLVRGQMFQVTIESLMDFLDDQSYGASLVQVERVNHQGLGVDPAIFDTFYGTVIATFKDILGPAWSNEMDAVWTGVVAELTAAG